MLPSAYEWYFLFQSFHQVLPVSEQEISSIFLSTEDFINNIYSLLNLKVEIPKYFWYFSIRSAVFSWQARPPVQYNLYACMCELLATYSWVYRCRCLRQNLRQQYLTKWLIFEQIFVRCFLLLSCCSKCILLQDVPLKNSFNGWVGPERNKIEYKHVTINCQITKNVMNSGSQLSELQSVSQMLLVLGLSKNLKIFQ